MTKIVIFANGNFVEKNDNFWQFFDSQMAIFRRVRLEHNNYFINLTDETANSSHRNESIRTIRIDKRCQVIESKRDNSCIDLITPFICSVRIIQDQGIIGNEILILHALDATSQIGQMSLKCLL